MAEWLGGVVKEQVGTRTKITPSLGGSSLTGSSPHLMALLSARQRSLAGSVHLIMLGSRNHRSH